MILSSVFGAALVGALVNSGLSSKAPLAPAHQGRVGPTILEENVGTIEQFVVQVPPGELDNMLATLHGLVTQLPQEAGGYFVVQQQEEAERLEQSIRDWSPSRPERFRVLAWPDLPLQTYWARDRFISLRDKNGQAVLAQPVPARVLLGGEFALPNLLSDRTGSFAVQPVEIYLEGGDLLAGRNWLLAGITTIRSAQEFHSIREAWKLRELLESYFGKRVVFLPDFHQAAQWPSALDFHLDMILTVLHDDTVLLADPAWGDRIIAEAAEQRTLSPEIAESLGRSSAEPERQRLDVLLKALQRAGIKVQRIPLYTVPGQPYALSYNNVIQDAGPDGHVVYLPQYGVESLDAQAAAIYASLGYRVCPIDVRGIYRRQGALHCLVNVVRRSRDR